MFAAKKIIISFILPSGILVTFLFLLSFYFYLKNKIRTSKRFLFFSFLLWLFSSNFWINYFICRTEKNINPSLDGDVIVFLSGGNVDIKDILTGEDYLSSSSLERLFAVYRVYKNKKLPVILTGGYVFNMKADSIIARKVLISLGVDEKNIFIDDKSRDTYENALYSKKISDIQGFKKPILVTESLHIPRSIIAFKKAGFRDISVYPSSFCCHKISFIDFLPSDFHIHRKFFYEAIGKIYYFKIM